MNRIHLRQTLPQVFADRDAITSDVYTAIRLTTTT